MKPKSSSATKRPKVCAPNRRSPSTAVNMNQLGHSAGVGPSVSGDNIDAHAERPPPIAAPTEAGAEEAPRESRARLKPMAVMCLCIVALLVVLLSSAGGSGMSMTFSSPSSAASSAGNRQKSESGGTEDPTRLVGLVRSSHKTDEEAVAEKGESENQVAQQRDVIISRGDATTQSPAMRSGAQKPISSLDHRQQAQLRVSSVGGDGGAVWSAGGVLYGNGHGNSKGREEEEEGADSDQATKTQRVLTRVLLRATATREVRGLLSAAINKTTERNAEGGENTVRANRDDDSNDCPLLGVGHWGGAAAPPTSSPFSPPKWFTPLYSALRRQLLSGGGEQGSSSSSSAQLTMAPYASAECAVVLPPIHVVQCLVYAVSSMTRNELEELLRRSDGEEEGELANTSPSPSPSPSSSPYSYNIFRRSRTRTFSRSLCAKLSVCIQWTYGTIAAAATAPAAAVRDEEVSSSSVDHINKEEDREAVDEQRVIDHFGVDAAFSPPPPSAVPYLSSSSSSLASAASPSTSSVHELLLRRNGWLDAARTTDMTPIVPLQPLLVMLGAGAGAATTSVPIASSSSIPPPPPTPTAASAPPPLYESAVIFDEAMERVRILKRRRGEERVAGDRSSNGAAGASTDTLRGLLGRFTVSDGLAHRSASEVIALLEQFAWKKIGGSNRKGGNRTTTVAFPSAVLFSGDSVLRAVFYELVSAIRTPLRISSSSLFSAFNKNKKVGGHTFGAAYDGKIMYIVMANHDALLSNLQHTDPHDDDDNENDGEDSYGDKSRKDGGGGGGQGIPPPPTPSPKLPDVPFTAAELAYYYEPSFDAIVANPSNFTDRHVLALLRPVSGSGGRGVNSAHQQQKQTFGGSGGGRGGAALDLRLRTFPARWVFHQLKRVCEASSRAGGGGGEIVGGRTSADVDRGNSNNNGATNRPSPRPSNSSSSRGHLCPRFIVLFEFDNRAGSVYKTYWPEKSTRVMKTLLSSSSLKDGGKKEGRGDDTTAAAAIDRATKQILLTSTSTSTPAPSALHALPPPAIGAHIHSFGVWPHAANNIVDRVHAMLAPVLFERGEIGALEEHKKNTEKGDKVKRNEYKGTKDKDHSEYKGTLFIERITSGYKHISGRDNSYYGKDYENDYRGGRGEGELSVSSHYVDALREALTAFVLPLEKGNTKGPSLALPFSSFSGGNFSSLSSQHTPQSLLVPARYQQLERSDKANAIVSPSSSSSNRPQPQPFDQLTPSERLIIDLLQPAHIKTREGSTGTLRRNKKGKFPKGTWEYIFSKVIVPMANRDRVGYVDTLAMQAMVMLAHTEGLLRVFNMKGATVRRNGKGRKVNGGVSSSTAARRPSQPSLFADLIPKSLISESIHKLAVDALAHSEDLLEALERQLLSLHADDGLVGVTTAIMNGEDRREDVETSTSSAAAAASASLSSSSSSSLYIYDAMQLQSLYPFAGNDYLHSDCHVSANSRRSMGPRMEPRVMPSHAFLMEKVHHSLFTVVDDDDEDEDGGGAEYMYDGQRSRGSGGASSSPPSSDVIGVVQPLCGGHHRRSAATMAGDASPKTTAGSSPLSITSAHLTALFYNVYLNDHLLSPIGGGWDAEHHHHHQSQQQEHQKGGGGGSAAGGCYQWLMRRDGVVAAEGVNADENGPPASSTYSSAFAPSPPECAVLISHNHNQCRNAMAANELAVILGRMRREI